MFAIGETIDTAEYKKSAKQLGDVIDSEPHPWSGGLSRHWIWDFLMNVTVDLPLVSRTTSTPRP